MAILSLAFSQWPVATGNRQRATSHFTRQPSAYRQLLIAYFFGCGYAALGISLIAILESIDTPLVILDEVQKIPSLFDPLKYVVDKQRRGGGPKKTFILTGSSQILLMKNIKETLAGRVALMNLYPFSLPEITGSDSIPILTSQDIFPRPRPEQGDPGRSEHKRRRCV